MLSVVLISLSTVAFAQSTAKKADVPKSEAQKSFDFLKTLAGSWGGQVTLVPQQSDFGKQIQVSMRVTSMGNALMHEMKQEGRPDDPITMLYLDGDRLLLTHYCDAGNRPRMTGKMSQDGKKVEFAFLDIAGNPQNHMHNAVFTVIDENRHTEDWTFMMEGKPVHAHFDLQRAR
jgi:hypothetical protein